eukprot:scaffold180_cov134-Isochrysis_galbana.AAC.2
MVSEPTLEMPTPPVTARTVGPAPLRKAPCAPASRASLMMGSNGNLHGEGRRPVGLAHSNLTGKETRPVGLAHSEREAPDAMAEALTCACGTAGGADPPWPCASGRTARLRSS